MDNNKVEARGKDIMAVIAMQVNGVITSGTRGGLKPRHSYRWTATLEFTPRRSETGIFLPDLRQSTLLFPSQGQLASC